MGKEIERKFLVEGDGYKALGKGLPYKQGYISLSPERTVRVRVCKGKGFLTLKGKAKGIARLEYEYEIPLKDAEEMLDKLCEKPVIEKLRYKCVYDGMVWEVDEFFGDNEGLVTAEIELENEKQTFSKPLWLGREVTSEPRYANSNLVKFPYKIWDTGNKNI